VAGKTDLSEEGSRHTHLSRNGAALWAWKKSRRVSRSSASRRTRAGSVGYIIEDDAFAEIKHPPLQRLEVKEG